MGAEGRMARPLAPTDFLGWELKADPFRWMGSVVREWESIQRSGNPYG